MKKQTIKKHLFSFLLLTITASILLGCTNAIPSSGQPDTMPISDAISDIGNTEPVQTESNEKKILDGPDLAEYVQARTVKVNTDNGSGSGFFIDSNGTIVTSYHVIDGATKIDVKISDGGEYPIEYIVDFNPVYDVAVIKIDISGNPYLSMKKEVARTGENVYAVGSSLGILDGSFTNGVISSSNRVVGNIKCYQTTAAISSGNSGGPLVNEHGEVIGINAFSYVRGNSLHLAVKLETLDMLSMDKNWKINKYNEWYDKEIHRSYKIYDSEEEDFVNSIINTYQHITGAECLQSSNDYKLDDSVNGYKENYEIYFYDYDVDQFDAYTEYLETLGFEYIEKEEYSESVSYYYENKFSGYITDIYVFADYIAIAIY